MILHISKCYTTYSSNYSVIIHLDNLHMECGFDDGYESWHFAVVRFLDFLTRKMKKSHFSRVTEIFALMMMIRRVIISLLITHATHVPRMHA